MYRHILVATDGEKFSRKAVATAIKLAALPGFEGAARKVVTHSSIPVLVCR